MKKNYTLSCATVLLAALPLIALPAGAEVLINLNASALPEGPLPTWTATGSLGGDFVATGAPAVAVVQGVKAVTLGGNGDFYAGPLAPDEVSGVNPSRSIEVWAYNPAIAGEETLVAWGHRGGPAGTNLAFNYGDNGSFGAVGHWDTPDLGWVNAGGAPAAGTWHYLVYTYDGGGLEGQGTTRVYADGVLMNSEAVGTLNTHTGFPFVLGGQNNDGGTPAGFNSGLSMARVRIHNVALTDAQIAAQYTAEIAELFPKAFFSGSSIVGSDKFAFRVTDRPPSSVADAPTFSIGVRGGWIVSGAAAGPANGSITSPSIAIAASGVVELTFKHSYSFEYDGTAWDGGVVQVSINGGDFQALDGGAFTQNGYVRPITGNNVLNGQDGFNGDSAGFASQSLITSVATIPGLAAGSTVRVRFLAAWDEGARGQGPNWEINSVAVAVNATPVFNADFAAGDGAFTAESELPRAGSSWSYRDISHPPLGPLTYAKVGDVTTFTLAIQWENSSDYRFTLSGKDTLGGALVFPVTVSAPGLPLATARTDWPAVLPGPLGQVGTWGVRTYLNEGIDTAEDLTAMLAFLATVTRTPEDSSEDTVDSQETLLNFVDPATNGIAGVIGCPKPFPGEALSTATNGGTARDDNHVVTTAHGSILISEEADYTFNLHGDDGFMFRITATSGPDPTFLAVGGAGSVDADARNLIYFPTGTGDATTRGIIHLTPGTYSLEYATWEGGGGFWYQVSAAKGFFPNDGDTNTWAAIGYISPRTTPIPYPSMVGNWTVLSTAPGDVKQGDLEGADAAVNAAVALDPVAATSSWPAINFQDIAGEGVSQIAGDSPWPRNTAANDDNWAMRMSGTLHIPEDGDYLIGYRGDDGSNLTVGGVHQGFSALVTNATNASAIGRANTIAANSGSVGAAANFNPETSAVFEQPGALAGSTDTAISTAAADGQKMRVPYTAALNPAGPFTAEIWLKPAQAPADLTCALSSGNFGDPRSGWLIYQDSANGWNFRGYINSGLATAFNIMGGGPITPDEWYHVAVTWNGVDTAKVYVDGALVASQDGITDYVPASAVGTGRLHIGSRADNAFGWSGSADELAIYGAELSETDIAAHYANGLDPARTTPYPTLVQASSPLGYWRLNESVQPRVDLGTISTNLVTGDSLTVGRIFLTTGNYPISSLFWESGGGASFEIFAAREVPGGCVPYQLLIKDGFPSVPGAGGLPLVGPPVPPAPVVTNFALLGTGAFTIAFSSEVGATYKLQSSLDLVTWGDISGVVPATGTSTTIAGIAPPAPNAFFYFDPAIPNQFYRVKRNP